MTPRPDPARGSSRLVLALLCLVALGLRALYAQRSGIWRDEALALDLVRRPAAELWSFLALHESHPPLFYFLLKGWQAVFGASEQAALVPPVLVGVMLVPACYVVGTRLFSRRAGLFAAATVAASPLLAEYSALIRPYSLLPLAALGSSYALVLGLAGGTRASWACYVLASSVLLWTHNWSVVLVAVQVLVTAGWLVLGAGDRPPSARPWGMSLAAITLAYSPWLPALWHQMHHAGHGPSQDANAGNVLALVAKCLSGVPDTTAAMLGLGVIAALALWGARRVPEQRLAYLVFGLAPTLAVAICALISPHTALLWPRTLVIVVPLLLLCACGGLAGWVGDRPRLTAALTLALVGGYLAVALPMLAMPKSNAREVAGAIALHAHPDDLIIIAPEWLAAGFNWYYQPANEQLDYPHAGREIAMAWDDLAERTADPAALERAKGQIAAARAAGRRIWLVCEGARVLTGPVPLVGLPADLPISHWTEVGTLRANQLLRVLEASYGQPSKRVVSPGSASGGEQLAAFLFEAKRAP